MTDENEWWYDPEHLYLTEAGMAKHNEESYKIWVEGASMAEIGGDLTREEASAILEAIKAAHGE